MTGKRACICGRIDCERHKPRRPYRKPPDSYGPTYKENRLAVPHSCRLRGGDAGIGGACEMCGRPGTADDPLEAGHIVPISRGGDDELTNLRAVHHQEQVHRPERRDGASEGGRSFP